MNFVELGAIGDLVAGRACIGKHETELRATRENH